MFEGKIVCDIMVVLFVFLFEVVFRDDVKLLFEYTIYNGFLVVDDRGKFVGFILCL